MNNTIIFEAKLNEIKIIIDGLTNLCQRLSFKENRNYMCDATD